MASGWEFEVEIAGVEYPCDLWARFVLTVDNNKEPIKHDECCKNSEDQETIFQHRLERVTDKRWRTEIETGRVYSGTPNNPVGYVEDF